MGQGLNLPCSPLLSAPLTLFLLLLLLLSQVLSAVFYRKGHREDDVGQALRVVDRALRLRAGIRSASIDTQADGRDRWEERRRRGGRDDKRGRETKEKMRTMTGERAWELGTARPRDQTHISPRRRAVGGGARRQAAGGAAAAARGRADSDLDAVDGEAGEDHHAPRILRHRVPVQRREEAAHARP